MRSGQSSSTCAGPRISSTFMPTDITKSLCSKQSLVDFVRPGSFVLRLGLHPLPSLKEVE